MGKGKKRRLRELDELLPSGKSLPTVPTVPATELPEHDLTFPHSATMLRVDPEGTGGCSARCPRRVAVDRAVLADASLTPAMREAFTTPIRYAAARYGSAAAGAAAWWEARAGLPGEPIPEPTGPAGGPTRSHICTRPDACLDTVEAAPWCPITGRDCTCDETGPCPPSPPGPPLLGILASTPRPEPETPQQRATRLDRERDDLGRAYRAAIHAADEAWREIGGRQ